ncbi:ABC-2 type transport system permease protein [Frankineae bacterium MT45]|nr:ABC-2 type transport system permease protein [Frankineae bacterium MT45]
MSMMSSAASSAASAARAEALADEPMLPASPSSGGLFKGTVTSIKAIWRYRDLLGLLFRRELKVRYKDSFFGFFWTFVRPLAQLLVYTIVIGHFLARGTPGYAVFVFSGLTIWQLFSEIVTGGTGAMLANGGLIKKVYLPREVFTLGVVGSALFNFVMQTIILVFGTFLAGKVPTGTRLLYAPLSIVIVVLFGTGLAFVLGAVNVYLRDVQYLVEVALMWGLWSAPIVYSISLVRKSIGGTWLYDLYVWSPITQAALGFQRAFWVAGTPKDTVAHLGRSMIITIGVLFVFVWICQRIFARLQSNFAQEL